MANINPKIFKAYDIRGIYPVDLDEAGIERTARAIYSFFKKKLNKEAVTVLIARDMRTSSPSLFENVKKALVAMGANVVDAGMLSTPTFYFAVSYYNYEAGIQVTASHNPKEYNGMKFVINTPNGLLKIGKPTGMEDVKASVMSDEQFPDAATPGTVTEKTGVGEDEVKNALTVLGNPQIKKFKIVADPANAMAITYLEALEKQVPMELIKMNFELDGTFPVHQPDPMQPKNLIDLQKRVKEEGADLGLAPDGDGDRLFIVDENADVVPPSLIVGIIAEEMLKKTPGGKVVVDQKYILTPEKVVKEFGGELALSKTGHAFITEKLTQIGGIFAGEASAHYYYKATGNAESQVMTIINVLAVLTEENKPLSVVAEKFRRSYESSEINFAVSNAQEIQDAMKEKYHDGELSELDGVTFRYPEWRFNLRSSNTEPLLRLNLEAYDKATMEAKRDEVIAAIKAVAHMEEAPEH